MPLPAVLAAISWKSAWMPIGFNRVNMNMNMCEIFPLSNNLWFLAPVRLGVLLYDIRWCVSYVMEEVFGAPLWETHHGACTVVLLAARPLWVDWLAGYPEFWKFRFSDAKFCVKSWFISTDSIGLIYFQRYLNVYTRNIKRVIICTI